jgi:hypothetical protein
MSLQEDVIVVTNHANHFAFDPTCYLREPTPTFDCRICLWIFESKSELDIHNSLEHMIINHVEHERNIEDPPIIQE